MIDLSTSNDLFNEICIKGEQNLNFFWLGSHPYHSVWELQKKIHEQRKNNKIKDVFLLLEHNHVYTFGKNANHNHLLPSYPTDAEVVDIDRGGDVTYHGPGQLVGYPIIDLSGYQKSISWYMRSLENLVIDTLSDFDINAYRKHKLTGVWVDDEKICAMGVRLSRWVTMHGFALNINPDMRYFDGMIPCGIFEHGVTSVKNLLNIDVEIKSFAKLVCQKAKNIFVRSCIEGDLH